VTYGRVDESWRSEVKGLHYKQQLATMTVDGHLTVQITLNSI